MLPSVTRLYDATVRCWLKCNTDTRTSCVYCSFSCRLIINVYCTDSINHSLWWGWELLFLYTIFQHAMSRDEFLNNVRNEIATIIVVPVYYSLEGIQRLFFSLKFRKTKSVILGTKNENCSLSLSTVEDVPLFRLRVSIRLFRLCWADEGCQV